MTESRPSAEDFWRASLALYGCRDVAHACLALQDGTPSLCVNILLLAIWMGQEHRSLNRTALHSLIEAAEPWQDEVLAPLRQSRRAAKPLADEELYKKFITLELELERAQQEAIVAALLDWPAAGDADCTAANLRGYGELAAAGTHKPDMGPLLQALGIKP